MNGLHGVQLHSSDYISPEQYQSIADLIYDTDPYIYPALFGSGDNGRTAARHLLPLIFESGEDGMFCKENLFLYLQDEIVVGIVLWIKGQMNWDPSILLRFSQKNHIPLVESNVMAVESAYVSSRYSEADAFIHLINICVSRRLQGQGIGTKMMQDFLLLHTEENLKLCVLDDNPAAINLYKSQGFHITGCSTGFSLGVQKPGCLDMEKKAILHPFGCLGCACENHCCTAYDGISDKLTSISDIKFTEIILTDSDVERLRAIHREDLIIKPEGSDISRIKTAADGTCLALRNGRCTVYRARPSICRAYPLYLDFFAGLCYINECKAFSRTAFKRPEEHKDELESLLDVYQFWIDHYRNELQKGEREE